MIISLWPYQWEECCWSDNYTSAVCKQCGKQKEGARGVQKENYTWNTYHEGKNQRFYGSQNEAYGDGQPERRRFTGSGGSPERDWSEYSPQTFIIKEKGDNRVAEAKKRPDFVVTGGLESLTN